MNEEKSTIGLVGLGLMGTAMSSLMIEAGYMVHGFDIDAVSCEAHRDRGGTVGDSPAAVARACETVLLSLPNGDIMREVCLGPDGVAVGAREGTLVVDTTTTRPREAIEVGTALAERNILFLDVGISGNSAMVARGEALAMVGGDLEHQPQLVDVLRCFCREVVSAGSLGDGMRAKLVVNHILTLNRFALAEGLVMAETTGMDPSRTLEIVKASAAYSRAMDMWGERMVDRSYEPPASRVRGGNKDLQLILEMGRESGAPTLALSQVDHVVRSMIAGGLGDSDNAILAERLRELAGIGDTVPWRQSGREGTDA